MSLQDKNNAWIKPSGQFMEVGYMEHNEYASEWYREKHGDKWFEKLEEDHEKNGNSYPFEELHSKGWVRLVTWSDGKTVVCGNCAPNDGRLDTLDPKLNSKQKETLQDWCMDNNFKYEDLFKD